MGQSSWALNPDIPGLTAAHGGMLCAGGEGGGSMCMCLWGGRAPSSSPQRSSSPCTHMHMYTHTLTFRFSCWISASVTACLIWSCRHRVALSP